MNGIRIQSIKERMENKYKVVEMVWNYQKKK